MQRAGNAAAEEISRRYSDRLRDGVRVYAGPGNNGGDGWVVASALARSGVDVTVVEAVEAKTPDAIAEKRAAMDSANGIRSVPLGERSESAQPGVVIDALLGTGSEGKPRGAIAEAISMVNALRADGSTVAALDIPSGLDATSGAHDACVIADATFSFGGIKRGSLLARDCCGEIVVLDIGLDDIPPERSTRADTNRIPRLPWLSTGHG